MSLVAMRVLRARVLLPLVAIVVTVGDVGVLLDLVVPVVVR